MLWLGGAVAAFDAFHGTNAAKAQARDCLYGQLVSRAWGRAVECHGSSGQYSVRHDREPLVPYKIAVNHMAQDAVEQDVATLSRCLRLSTVHGATVVRV